MAAIDRIKYDADSDEWLVWKYDKDDIRLGSQLIVNQSQQVLFFKGGQALDLFGPGTHTLSTGNLPLLNKLINLPFGGETPFTAEVWFINLHAKRDLRWGTRAPIPLSDPVYHFPVHVRAFGQLGIRVQDSRSLLTQLVGTLKELSTQRVFEYFSGEVVQRLSDALSKYFVENGVSIFDANARLNELSQYTSDAIRSEFMRFGLEVVNFNVERISMPESDMKRFQDVLGEKMRIDQLNTSQVGGAYTAARTFDVLERVAGADGGTVGSLLAGGIGVGMGIGGGMAAGQQIAKAISVPPASEQPAPRPSNNGLARLREMKQAFDEGLISQQDFDDAKAKFLDPAGQSSGTT